MSLRIHMCSRPTQDVLLASPWQQDQDSPALAHMAPLGLLGSAKPKTVKYQPVQAS